MTENLASKPTEVGKHTPTATPKSSQRKRSGIYAKFKKIIDKLASTENYTSLREIIYTYEGNKIGKNQTYSSMPSYKTLNKFIHDYLSHKGIIEYDPTRKSKKYFRYKEEFRNYFQNSQKKHKLNRLSGDERRLAQCSGLSKIFNTQNLSDPIICMECVENLCNIRLLKELLKYLRRQVITFSYRQGYENLQTITLSPHTLKEYNSRWFLCGFVHKGDESEVANFSIDRIVDRGKNKTFIVNDKEPLRVSPDGFYDRYFKNVIGVTRPEVEKTHLFVIRTQQFKVHQLIKTKPLHQSQVITKDFDKSTQEGEFTIEVIPNIELLTRLMSFGPGLRVVSEGEWEEKYIKAVRQMAEYYK